MYYRRPINISKETDEEIKREVYTDQKRLKKSKETCEQIKEDL